MNLTPADISAIQGNDNGMFGGGSCWILILFFFLFAGNGFGGNRGGEQPATSADIQRGFDNNAVINKLNGLENGLSSTGFALNNSIKDGDYATQSAIAGVGSKIDACCCATNRNIDGIRTDLCEQTYKITNAIHTEGETTRALINANLIQDLRDKVNDKDREIQSAQFQLSQLSQTSTVTSNILDSLGRYVTNPACPVPCNPCGAYPVVY